MCALTSPRVGHGPGALLSPFPSRRRPSRSRPTVVPAGESLERIGSKLLLSGVQHWLLDISVHALKRTLATFTSNRGSKEGELLEREREEQSQGNANEESRYAVGRFYHLPGMDSRLDMARSWFRMSSCSMAGFLAISIVWRRMSGLLSM